LGGRFFFGRFLRIPPSPPPKKKSPSQLPGYNIIIVECGFKLKESFSA